MKTTDRNHRLDPATLARLAWIEHVARHAFGRGDLRASAIVRRSIDVYAQHLDVILAAGPHDYGELRRACERTALQSAARGSDLDTPLGVLLTLPVRPLKDILKDQAQQRPTVADMIRRDLQRWSIPTNNEEGEHDYD